MILLNEQKTEANLIGAKFLNVNLIGAYLTRASLNNGNFEGADLRKACFMEVNIEGVKIIETHIIFGIFPPNSTWLILKRAILIGANLKGANLRDTLLKGAENLEIDQLSKVKTLYNAKLDDELLIQLKKKFPALFEEPK